MLSSTAAIERQLCAMRADMAEVKQVLGAIYLQLQGEHAQGVDGSTLETLTAFKAAAKCAQEVIVVDEATNSIQDGAAMVSTDVIESVEVGSSGEDKTAVNAHGMAHVIHPIFIKKVETWPSRPT